MTFVPPKVDQNVWATYVEGRSPKFKVHSSRAHANSAIGNHYPQTTITLYHLETGEWAVSEVWEKPVGCARCKGTLMHKFGNSQWSRESFYPKHDPESKATPAFTRDILCYTCYEVASARALSAKIEARERKTLQTLKNKYDN